MKDLPIVKLKVLTKASKQTFSSVSYGKYRQSSAAPTADPTMARMHFGNVKYMIWRQFPRKTVGACHTTRILSLLNQCISGLMLVTFS